MVPSFFAPFDPPIEIIPAGSAANTLSMPPIPHRQPPQATDRDRSSGFAAIDFLLLVLQFQIFKIYHLSIQYVYVIM